MSRHDHNDEPLRSMLGRPFSGEDGAADVAKDGETVVDRIYKAFARYPNLNLESVRVTSMDGEIILSGSADTREARRAAEDATWSVFGVTAVSNNIQVTGGRVA